MPVIYVLLVLAVAGLLTWALVTFIPMPKAFDRLIVAVAVIAAIIWTLEKFGLLGYIEKFRLGR